MHSSTAKHAASGLGRSVFMRLRWEGVGPKMRNNNKRQRYSNTDLTPHQGQRKAKNGDHGPLRFGHLWGSGIKTGKVVPNKIQDIATGMVSNLAK